MKLEVVSITEDFAVTEAFDILNKEAFPPEDYVPIHDQIELNERDDFGLHAFYDGDEFVGFMLVMTYGSLAYLLLFAIDSKKRSRGYGSAGLRAFHEQYPDVLHVLDIEMVDDEAENNDQRISRRSFYLRNGYRRTGWFMDYGDAFYEILSDDDTFDIEEFKRAMVSHEEGYSPRFFQKDEA